MDSNGRVLLPIAIRYKLDLNQGDKFAIDQLGDGTIILKKIDLSEELFNAISLDEVRMALLSLK